MAVHLALITAGAIGVLIGLSLTRRLWRWTPRISPDLTDYDPGPDFLDWLQAASLVVLGTSLLVVATVV